MEACYQTQRDSRYQKWVTHGANPYGIEKVFLSFPPSTGAEPRPPRRLRDGLALPRDLQHQGRLPVHGGHGRADLPGQRLPVCTWPFAWRAGAENRAGGMPKQTKWFHLHSGSPDESITPEIVTLHEYCITCRARTVRGEEGPSRQLSSGCRRAMLLGRRARWAKSSEVTGEEESLRFSIEARHALRWGHRPLAHGTPVVKWSEGPQRAFLSPLAIVSFAVLSAHPPPSTAAQRGCRSTTAAASVGARSSTGALGWC